MEQNISNEQRRVRIFENISLISQAMASPARLRIVQVLSNRSCTVETISRTLGESIANTSQHLQKLLKSGIVTCEKQGVSRIYRLSNEEVVAVWLSLQNLANQLDHQIRDDEAALCPHDLVTELEPSEVMKQVNSGKAILVDVREEADFETTPVPGARHIPTQNIEKRYKELPKSKTIFLFCRGRYCSLANSAVEFLRKKGFKTFRVKESSFQLRKLAKAN